MLAPPRPLGSSRTGRLDNRIADPSAAQPGSYLAGQPTSQRKNNQPASTTASSPARQQTSSPATNQPATSHSATNNNLAAGPLAPAAFELSAVRHPSASSPAIQPSGQPNIQLVRRRPMHRTTGNMTVRPHGPLTAWPRTTSATRLSAPRAHERPPTQLSRHSGTQPSTQAARQPHKPPPIRPAKSQTSPLAATTSKRPSQHPCQTGSR